MNATAAVAEKVLEFNLQLEQIQILQIEPTSFCNAHCPHCPRFSSTGELDSNVELGHLNIGAISSNIEIEKLVNLKHIVLEGDLGDPLMHPQILEIIKFFSKAPQQPQIELVTNGSIRNPTWWEQLASVYHNLYVTFSIDGLHDTNHLYRVGLDFNSIIKNAQSFISAGGVARWKFIKFKHNEHQIAEAIQMSKDLGFVEFVHRPCDTGRFQNLSKWPVMINNNISHYIEPAADGSWKTLALKGKKIKNFVGSWSQHFKEICPNLVNGHLYISHQNLVIPCCMMHAVPRIKNKNQTHFLEMAESFEFIDLTKNKLSAVLQSKLYNHNLANSLKDQNWNSACENSCSSEIHRVLKYVSKI
jgi:MoaA/NifB/PqqE/SkfB family radical SAM enzyme